MMGNREPTARPDVKPIQQVESVTLRRKDPGMNAETLQLGAPPPSAPSPTYQVELVSPFLVTNHPHKRPHNKHQSFIQSPFLVQTTPSSLPEEPNLFDLEELLKESEVYPLSLPFASTPLPNIQDMISHLTGISLTTKSPPSQSIDSPPLRPR